VVVVLGSTSRDLAVVVKCWAASIREEHDILEPTATGRSSRKRGCCIPDMIVLLRVSDTPY
jgi:hypothetical protein